MSIFIPAWNSRRREFTLVFSENLTLIPKWNLTPSCFHARLLDRIEISLWVFLCMILTCEQFFFFFHSGLKSEFFIQNWHHRKLHRSEFHSFVNYEMIKQITKEKVNERWLLKGYFTFLSIKNVRCIWNV